MMVLGDGQAETESYWVDQQDNLNNICDDEAEQSEFSKMLAKHYLYFTYHNILISEFSNEMLKDSLHSPQTRITTRKYALSN